MTNKDTILDVILSIDIIIILILFLNFNFYLVILDAVFSSILIFDIIKNNNENKIQLLKHIGINFPYDLFIFALIKFYPPVLLFSNISLIKFLRIIKILKLIKTMILIMRYQQAHQRIEKIDKVFDVFNKKISAKFFFVLIFMILYGCAIFLPYFENIKGLDILYFIIITFSSVGYGDVIVSTIYGKIIAIIISLMSILGIGFLSALFLTYTNIDQEKETISLKEVNDLKSEINNLKEQNEKIIELLEKN